MPDATTHDRLILEGIVTTLAADGSLNVSPMGPLVDRQITQLTLRPYQTSRTYQNLKRTGRGVLQVTDDVELIAQAAIGRLISPALVARAEANAIPCAWQPLILAAACRWFAFRVTSLDDAAERTTIECEVIDQGDIRPFFGFNRAKHAVIEAAILATRIHLLPPEEIQQEFDRLSILIHKTAGSQEQRAFDLLREYVRKPR